jgi:hypothetical protein
MKALSLVQAQSYGKFGIRTMGAHCVFKLRYSIAQAERFLNNQIAQSNRNDIYTFTPRINNKGKQYKWIIAVVTANSEAHMNLLKLNMIVKADKLVDQAETLYHNASHLGNYIAQEQDQYTMDYENVLDWI